MARGGKRPGAGRKKGAQTLEKEAMREIMRERVSAYYVPLIDSQIANAMGIKYLVVRQKTSGKFLRVAEGAAAKLNADEEIIEVWEKDPSVQAFADLLNRILGKPAEHVEVTGAEGGALVIKHELPE